MRSLIKSGIPFLVLISTPALAIDPAYLGVWAPSPSYSPRWLRAAGSPGVGIGASLTVAHVSLLDMIGLVGAGG
jgi:hypothetical protein